MNKYEMRAEAVLKKREEYYIKRAEKVNRAVKITAAVAACVAVVASVEFASKYLVKKPIAPEVIPKPTESVAATLQYAYNGKPVFVSKEIENQGNYVTCYINDANEENPYNESNSYGVMSEQGEIVVPPIYNNAYAVDKNCFVVEKRDENHDVVSALTDSEGNILFDYFRGYFRPVSYGPDVYVLITESYNGKDWVVKTDGTLAIDIGFDNLTYAYTADVPHGFENDELILGIYNNEIYVISYKGEIKGIYGEEPKIKKALGNGFNLTAAYIRERKTLRLGVCDDAGNEIIPCEYGSLYFTGNRFVARNGSDMGLDPHDVAVIYDTEGNLVCESGAFLDIIFEYGAETGIGRVLGEWDDEKMLSIGGCWVIDKNGNKLSGEYDSIGKNADGTYTAHYDGHTKTHLLDANGKVVE